MKHFVFILCICLLALSGCLPANGLPATLQPQDIIGTIVGQTLTARPKDTLVAPTNTMVPNTSTPVPPTYTPLPPRPTSTSSWTLSPTLPTPAPDQFIRTYYYNINIANYPYTWSLLDLNFITTMNHRGMGGYAGYVKFWNSVHEVRVMNVVVAFRCDGCVVVNVTARYHYNNGVINTVTDPYILVFDVFRNTWLFDSSLAPVVTPTYTPTHTPVHTPTRTHTRTFTHTPTFTLTGTATLTDTVAPSDTPIPTDTPSPTP
jgi:hypothetical protein